METAEEISQNLQGTENIVENESESYLLLSHDMEFFQKYCKSH